jgi:alpha-D-xyloside xylohydrolase
MFLEFPDDPTCAFLDRQYMLGEALLVAPVFNAEGEVEYYLPEGTWTDLLTGFRVEGGRWIRDKRGYLRIPVLVRPDCAVPVGMRDDRPDYDYENDIALQIFSFSDGALTNMVIRDTEGGERAVFEVSRRGSLISAIRKKGAKPWRLELVGETEVAEVSGGPYVRTERSLVVSLAADADRVAITLRESSGVKGREPVRLAGSPEARI